MDFMSKNPWAAAAGFAIVTAIIIILVYFIIIPAAAPTGGVGLAPPSPTNVATRRDLTAELAKQDEFLSVVTTRYW
jgi:hypothetical protein